MIRRIYVEKKKGFDVEAQNLFSDLKENLHPAGLTAVRVINRYDIEGIDSKTYDAARYSIFAEPAIDTAYDEQIPIDEDSQYFAVEYLPGQYDQRADSAEQCIKLMSAGSEVTVRFARLIVLIGNISAEEFEAVKKYSINPVDSHEAVLEKPKKLELQAAAPENVKTVDYFTEMTDQQLKSYRENQGFAMSQEDLIFVREYFSHTEKRDPTVTELKVIDTYWSDHCRHTTFLTKINSVFFEEGPYSKLIQEAFLNYLNVREDVYGNSERDMSLMDMAVIGAKYLKKKGLVNDLDESDEINACSIKVQAVVNGKEEDWLVMFKNETHNHPTEIEPFGGAATCLGGAIRDPLSGRVYVYHAMRVTGSGDPRKSLDETLPGKLPQRIITKGAAKGYSSYGNQIGLSTGQVSEIYDEGYVAKRMEIGAVIGAAPASHVRREKPEQGDIILLIGGRTGRDGCGGATGSSKGHTEESIISSGAEVQKGNPPVERNIQRLFRREEAARLIKRCNDFGAGGVSVAIGELADGIDVNLDLVPKKYEGLDGTELAISESQERMAAVIAEKDVNEFIRYAQEENLEAVAVAKVTDTDRFRMYWRGTCILDLSRKFLNTNGVKQEIDVYVLEREFKPELIEDPNEKLVGSKTDLTGILKDLNCCSQKGLIEMFDSTIGTATVLMPLGGKYQLSPAAGMAAKLPVKDGFTNTATLMTYGFDPKLSILSPFHSAYYAVIDSITKIAAMGGDYSKVRLTFQEYFEKLGQDPVKWNKPFTALLGALRAQIELGIPSIGGKDSMSGSFMDLHVPPTLVSFAVGVTDANYVISTELKKENSKLVYITADRDEQGMLNMEQYRANLKRVYKLALESKVLSSNTIGKGGIFVSAVKMAVGNMMGVDLFNITDKELRSPDYGALLLEIAENENIEELMAGTCYKVIGKTAAHRKLTVQTLKDENQSAGTEFSIKLDEIRKIWTEPLEGIFPSKRKAGASETIEKPERISYTTRSIHKPAVKIAKPRILIPVFPGTNCEVDSKRAFEKAGGTADIQILRNLTPSDLNGSISEMEKKIRNSQIIMIPGGFSGGDEPDGSAKFITAVFRNPVIRDAVEDLLERRDGLMLGICNGFQALIKLGLVPYGTITEPNAGNPTLTYNRIGRHASCLVRTRIASVKSPWLANVEVGDIHTIPVSHGEGRFIAEEDVILKLLESGQIATQYVDPDGIPTMDGEYNPNESMLAIEGITSVDGRIFGKMGHSERIGENLYRNVPGNYDQKIFEAGVAYFTK
ncbi:MAG: phosphoribosylformylglycinamidine synthase [Eubacteriales bacterium]|nr:phosphoribosylformylglycinamidine synthase [Eubacteriales bacterium]MDD3199372.1 phosphoribosylformylglycinamidine synthase [Eubacteriales bacterium]